MKQALFLISAVGLALVGVRGAELSGTPAPPYVAAIPVPGQWTVTIVAVKPADAGAAPSVVSEEYAYSAELRSEISIWSDGRRNEDWLTKGILLSRQNGGKYLLDPHFQPFSTPLSATSFRDFDWVSAAYFTGTEKIKGRECNVYKDGAMIALVDAETKLPVQLTNNGLVCTYAFRELKSPLTLPPELAGRLAEYERQLKGMTVNRAPR